MNNAIQPSITLPVYYSENDKNLTIDREEMLREFNERIDLIEKQLKGEPMSKPISDNAVTDICIRVMDFLTPEELGEEEDYDFETQDELKTIVQTWLTQNNISFEPF